MNKYIIANYKMNGDKKFYSKVVKQFNKVKTKDTNIILCPPFIYAHLFKLKNQVAFGAQDIANIDSKKCTGQISPKMLKEFGCTYTLIGHSERRSIGETDQMIAQKVSLAITNNITPIVCVGENQGEDIEQVLTKQLKSVFDVANGEMVVAYEPIWAIGSGKIPTLKQINFAVKTIKDLARQSKTKTKVLYGGSVDVNNIDYLKKAKVDGFLLGGVSLRTNELIDIIKRIDNE